MTKKEFNKTPELFYFQYGKASEVKVDDEVHIWVNGGIESSFSGSRFC
jgi:hypothetical protein